jgi:hypothetical protein
VSKEDLVRTVTTAYANGWRQVKLYFMCGLPTETDEDVLEIADLAVEVIKAGREASGQKDIRCTVSIGGFVPKPHTPFQWAGQASAETIDHRLRLLRQKINEDRRIGRSIGLRYHDGKPGVIEGLLSRGDRRVGRVIERVWREGGKFDGWSEHFSFDRWTTAAPRSWPRSASTSTGSPPASAPSTRSCPGTTWTPGLDKEFLWDDWQERLTRRRSPTAGGPPATTAASARPWAPRSRSAHRAQPAAAHRRLMARQPDGPAPAADRPEAAHPLRQARPAALRLPPRPRPHPRAGAAARPGADGVLGRVQPAPEDLLPRRRPDRRGQRGRVPRDRRRVRCEPDAAAGALDAALPDDVAVLEVVEAARGPARWPTGSTPRSGGWSCPA